MGVQLGLWATIAAALTAFVERPFWPMTLGFIVALPVVVRWPDLRSIAGAVSTVGVTPNVVMNWILKARDARSKAPPSQNARA